MWVRGQSAVFCPENESNFLEVTSMNFAGVYNIMQSWLNSTQYILLFAGCMWAEMVQGRHKL